MKNLLGYFTTIMISLSFTGCREDSHIKNFESYINEIKLTESKFSNQSDPESPLREKFYIIDFLDIGKQRDGYLRIVSRINSRSLISITLIEEKNLNSKKILSVPVETFSEECNYQSENDIVSKLLSKAKNYRLSEDYSKKVKTKIEMLSKNQLCVKPKNQKF